MINDEKEQYINKHTITIGSDLETARVNEENQQPLNTENNVINTEGTEGNLISKRSNDDNRLSMRKSFVSGKREFSIISTSNTFVKVYIVFHSLKSLIMNLLIKIYTSIPIYFKFSRKSKSTYRINNTKFPTVLIDLSTALKFAI